MKLNKFQFILIILFFIALAFGIHFRTNGLGEIGFSGDEETTTMAALGIQENGIPQFPSGMKYYRGLPHSYMIHLSFKIFGEGDWQARLPSVILGIGFIFLIMYLAYIIYPNFSSIMIVGIFAALSCYQIEEARTARMYGPFIFFHTIYLIYAVKYFKTNGNSHLFLALFFFIISIFFHTIGIFGIFFLAVQFFFTKEIKEKVLIFLSSGFAGISWIMIDYFNSSAYLNFRKLNSLSGDVGTTGNKIQMIIPDLQLIPLLIGVVILMVFVLLSRKAKINFLNLYFLPVILLFVTGFVHLAWIFFLLYLLVFRKFNGTTLLLMIFGVFCTSVYLLNSYLIVNSLNTAIKNTFILPHFTEVYFIRNFTVFAVSLLVLYYFAYRTRLSIFKLLFYSSILSLFALSFFRYDFPIRYLAYISPVMLLVYSYFLFTVVNQLNQPRSKYVFGIILFIVIFSEISPWNYITSYFNVSYGDPMYTWEYARPDHKGAAEYVKKHYSEKDIIISIDALETQYYLGRVDYWLRDKRDLGTYLYQSKDSLYRDIYTNAIHIENIMDIKNKISNSKVVWLIDSGETYAYPSTGEIDWLRKYYLPDDVIRFISDSGTKLVYRGKDNLTNVYKFENQISKYQVNSKTENVKIRHAG